jgi:outer membrane lipoprotein SlyB
MKLLTLILGAAITCSACAGGGLRPTDVARGDARELKNAEQATVIDIYTVTLESNREIAQGTGAAFGGYVANRAAMNENAAIQALATGAGALVGSVVGNTVSDLALDKTGTGLILEMANGKTLAISQQNDSRVDFTLGDRVWVIREGKTVRVVPVSQ